jgi:hypothetical protein
MTPMKHMQYLNSATIACLWKWIQENESERAQEGEKERLKDFFKVQRIPMVLSVRGLKDELML